MPIDRSGAKGTIDGLRRARERGIDFSPPGVTGVQGRFMGFVNAAPTDVRGYMVGDVVIRNDGVFPNVYVLIQFNANLRVWTSALPVIPEANVTNLTTDLAAKLPATAYTVCTSSTHPGSPSVGDKLFETDTGNELTYQGATDTWTQPWNQPWGIMGIATITANQTTISAVTDITGLTLTLTYVAHRRIKITAWCEAMQSTTGTDAGQVLITDATPTTVATAGVGDAGAAAGQGTECTAMAIVSPAAGSKLYKVRALRAAGVGTFTFVANATSPAFLLIEDMGPNGLPS